MSTPGKVRRIETNVAETFQLPPTTIEQFTLSNGLRVILSPDNTVPVVSIAVYYDVGSRNEGVGPHRVRPPVRAHDVSGLGRHVKKAEHFQLIMKAGGTMNGTTSSRADQLLSSRCRRITFRSLSGWKSDRMRSLDGDAGESRQPARGGTRRETTADTTISLMGRSSICESTR